MDSWVQLVIQVPLVGAFMWFVITWSDRMAKHNAASDAKWQLFLDNQRKIMIASLGQMSQGMQKMVDQLQEMQDIITRHDVVAREAVDAAQDIGRYLRTSMMPGTQPLTDPPDESTG